MNNISDYLFNVEDMSYKVIHIDELTTICGYANSETPVNNCYGCDHPECAEKEIVRVQKDGTHERFIKNIEQKILMISLRKKYGSWQNIQKALETAIPTYITNGKTKSMVLPKLELI